MNYASFHINIQLNYHIGDINKRSHNISGQSNTITLINCHTNDNNDIASSQFKGGVLSNLLRVVTMIVVSVTELENKKECGEPLVSQHETKHEHLFSSAISLAYNKITGVGVVFEFGIVIFCVQITRIAHHTHVIL